MRKIPSVNVDKNSGSVALHFNPNFCGMWARLQAYVYRATYNPETNKMCPFESLRFEWRNEDDNTFFVSSLCAEEFLSFKDYQTWEWVCSKADVFFAASDVADFRIDVIGLEEPKLENPFCVYRGGGYEGCFWQWDVYFVSEGKSLYGAGYASEDFEKLFPEDREEALKKVEEDDGMFVEYPSDYVEFQKEFGVDLVVDTGKYLDWGLVCPVCFCICESAGFSRFDPRGAGGFVIEHTGLCCEECTEVVIERSLEATW